MFRPSPNLLFSSMPALNKLKIHHPIPLNPRESAQLLNILTSSFRQHLDKAHPGFNVERDVPRPRREPTIKSALPANQNANDAPRHRRRSRGDSAAHYADQHLHSLLTDPLFKVSPTGSKGSATDPMDIFERAVANGMMTTRYAYACLKMKYREILQSTVLDVRDGMRDSGAGRKVLKWLVSSGTANDNNFLRDMSFGAFLMRYLVAEGLEEAAWTWVKRAIIAEPGTGVEDFTEHAMPLLFLTRAVAAGRPGPPNLDSAYLCVSRAAGYLNGKDRHQMRTALGASLKDLSRRTIFGVSGVMPETPSETAFESFFSLIPILQTDVDYYLAHLSLLHPTKPCADLALDYLRQQPSSPELFGLPERPKTTRIDGRIQLGLDAAKFLLRENRSSEAEWVMNFLSANFPKELGIAGKKELDQVKAEAAISELLEGLKFG